MEQERRYDVDTSTLRRDNPESKWLFPVRVVTSGGVVRWYANIIVALSKLRKPLDRLSWENLLRQKRICGETTEEDALLRDWWNYGWKETPKLPYVHSVSIPVIEVRDTMDGEEIEWIYPSLRAIQRKFGIHRRDVVYEAEGVRSKMPHKWILLREHTRGTQAELTKVKFKWTVFDNTTNAPVGHFKSLDAIGEYIGIPYTTLCGRTRQTEAPYCGKKLNERYWVWYEEWGFVPIAPDGTEVEWELHHENGLSENGQSIT